MRPGRPEISTHNHRQDERKSGKGHQHRRGYCRQCACVQKIGAGSHSEVDNDNRRRHRHDPWHVALNRIKSQKRRRRQISPKVHEQTADQSRRGLDRQRGKPYTGYGACSEKYHGPTAGKIHGNPTVCPFNLYLCDIIVTTARETGRTRRQEPCRGKFYPFTHNTCFKVCTTSTRSLWFAITVSMSL
jgi:hypothetical protein